MTSNLLKSNHGLLIFHETENQLYAPDNFSKSSFTESTAALYTEFALSHLFAVVGLHVLISAAAGAPAAKSPTF